MLCSSLIFQRIVGSKYFQKNQKIIIGQLWVFQKINQLTLGILKIRNKESAKLGYLKTFKEWTIFMKELVIFKKKF
jgi:hypothetical protein